MNIRLRALNAGFVGDCSPDGNSHSSREDFNLAQGIIFDCPICLGEKNHSILVWFKDRGVPDAAEPKPDRWAATGTTLDDLTLTPSIDCSPSKFCTYHGFITNGNVT